MPFQIWRSDYENQVRATKEATRLLSRGALRCGGLFCGVIGYGDLNRWVTYWKATIDAIGRSHSSYRSYINNRRRQHEIQQHKSLLKLGQPPLHLELYGFASREADIL